MAVSSLRWDRVVALRNGHNFARVGHGHYTCLMARDAKKSAQCAEHPPVELPTSLSDAVSYVMCLVPDELKQLATWSPLDTWRGSWVPPSGLLGQVCLDTFAYHVPPEIVSFHHCVDRHGNNRRMAYVSNLAVI